jgi:hypothetical protein
MDRLRAAPGSYLLWIPLCAALAAVLLAAAGGAATAAAAAGGPPGRDTASIQFWLESMLLAPAAETTMLLALAWSVAGTMRSRFVREDRQVVVGTLTLAVLFTTAHVCQNGSVALATLPMVLFLSFLIQAGVVARRSAWAWTAATLAHGSYNGFILMGGWLLSRP